MDRETAIGLIKRHEPELRELGVVSLSLFGSTARDDATDSSDVDVAVRLKDVPHGFAYFGRINRIEFLLSQLLGRRVDIVSEPARKTNLQYAIEQDRCRAF